MKQLYSLIKQFGFLIYYINKQIFYQIVPGSDQKSGDENDSETEPETNDTDDSDDIIGLPDDEWGNDFDFSMIDLPENTDNFIAEINESIDLWNDLILIEDSMELNFDLFSDDDALAISLVSYR